jgi:hypothetical protein
MSTTRTQSAALSAEAIDAELPDNVYELPVADDLDSDDGGTADPVLDDTDIEAELAETADPRPRRQRRREPPKIRNPRRPGFTGTVRDYDGLRIIVEEQARREHPDWPEEAVYREAEKRYQELCRIRHPKLPQEYLRLMQVSWCPERRYIRENIESYAMRKVPEAIELESILRQAQMGPSAATCERRLPVAVFLRSAWQNLHPEFRSNFKDFAGSNLELDWAFFDTADMSANAQHMRDETSTRRTMKAMLERHHPLMLQRLHLQVVQRIAERHDDVGSCLVVDATPIQAFVEQDIGVTQEHREHISRGTGATLHSHGDGSPMRRRKRKHWVGWQLLVIADLKTGLPLVWELINGAEFKHVMRLMMRLFRLAPWIDPWVLVGDAEYDRSARLALDLQQRLGVLPCFPLRNNVSDRYHYARNAGVPRCPEHGVMKRVQDNDFIETAVNLGYERDYDAAKRSYNGRIRWRCEACKNKGIRRTANTWVRRNPRLYTYFPRKWTDHYLYATREALMLRRNSIEAIFSQLKRRGIGARDHYKARWVTRPIHMEWLVGTALFGLALRREVHETDNYERGAELAWHLGLTKVRPQLPAKGRPPHPWQREPRMAA